jgi:2-oxoacid:acceptor oxidoreductase gamma subunit (pyruvate/2-ketoisovalerate family)
MIEVRIHGRGGQGAVVASAVLASALFYDGRYVQAFPAFGVERRGAPVMAFTRWDFWVWSYDWDAVCPQGLG